MANPLVLVLFASITGSIGSGEEPPDDNGVSVQPQQKMSFRDKTMVNKEKPSPRQRVDLLRQNLEKIKIEYEDENPLKLMVLIAYSVVDGLCAPWQDAPVVKLFGKRLGFNIMKEQLIRHGNSLQILI